jgi:hypothetical protein
MQLKATDAETNFWILITLIFSSGCPGTIIATDLLLGKSLEVQLRCKEKQSMSLTSETS